MDREPRKDNIQPSQEPEAEKQAERNRDALDKVPAPGTDPLHEGP